MSYFIGIDIGSTCAKTIVMDRERRILHRLLQPTGWSSVETAEEIKKKLLDLAIDVEKEKVVATGYGRVSVPYADKCVTEISCHGKGAAILHESADVLIIDIGGQDTKIIEVQGGAVTDFLMNDKCSAGTGRFLEVMANTLGVDPKQLCEMAREGGNTTISSLCTVFAESEVISLIGRGESRENIAFAVIDSIASKVISQAGHLNPRNKLVCLTGGLCDYDYLRDTLSEKLHVTVNAKPDGRYAGAIGAASFAVAMEE
ncbi:CoA-substrate-specific enzyme activase, putative [Lachnospiraceae bacterium XBB1006]|nr:CoA-substrate-specific enzyme activase, putative [Lachnospiraceae bacterium XBB1006]